MKPVAQTNKAAWEEAFDVRVNGFGADHARRLNTEAFPFLGRETAEALRGMMPEGATVAQFCCNNGRELMSVVRNTRAREGFGFDIAENILAQARDIAAETGIPCTFVPGDVYEAAKPYADRFDLVLVTAGALCWMEDLDAFFGMASRCLRTGGRLLVHEMHPFTNMLSVPGEDIYDKDHPDRLPYSYFRSEPFVDCFGMEYLAGKTYESKPFVSFSHTLWEIVGGVARGGLRVERLTEYNRDVGGTAAELDGKGFPLSFLLTAAKS